MKLLKIVGEFVGRLILFTFVFWLSAFAFGIWLYFVLKYAGIQ